MADKNVCPTMRASHGGGDGRQESLPHRLVWLRPAFTLIEMLLATVLCAVLMLAVLTAVSAIGRDQQRLTRASTTPRYDEAIRLMKWDLANAREARFDGALVLEGHGALDARTLEPTHRLVRVRYALRQAGGRGVLVRTQEALDDPLRATMSQVVAVGVTTFNVRGVSEDAVIELRGEVRR